MNAVVNPLSTSELLRYQAAVNQGVKAVQSGAPGLALAHYEEGLGILRDGGTDPQLGNARARLLMNYGDALARCARHDEARAAFEESIEIDSSYDQTWYNLGVVLEKMGDLEGAREKYLEAARRRAMPATLNNLANVETWLARMDDAERHYRMAIKQGFNDAIWNLSLCLLMQGKYAEGWDWYHFRPQMGSMRDRPALWRGEDLKGKTLLIITEQGLGDTVFALRYLPMLRERGARLMIACDVGLKRLIEAMVAETAEGELPVMVIEKTPSGIIPAMSFDYETLAMSIPGYLTPDGTGPRTAYLKAQGVPMPNDRLNVGLCWNGSTAVGVPAERNIPLALLAPLGKIPGVRFVSLQKGDGVEEIEGCGFPVHDAMSGVRDVYDTACLIASLDLVISIDTLIPHLAGALGKPVWLMNRFGSCWQWGTPRFEPQLYATVQQFRQHVRGDWSHVVAHLTHALEQVARAWRPEAFA